MKLPDGSIRSHYAEVATWLSSLTRAELVRNQKEAEAIFRRSGITFAVYGGVETNERLIPFDIIPRLFAAAEWRRLAADAAAAARSA